MDDFGGDWVNKGFEVFNFSGMVLLKQSKLALHKGFLKLGAYLGGFSAKKVPLFFEAYNNCEPS